MKKIFAIVACVAMSLAANAQAWSSEKPENPVKFGVQAGMNISSFSYEDDSPDSKIGFNAGVTLDYSIVKSFAIKTGLFFTMKGAKTSESYAGVDDDWKATPMYLELPILASYRYNFSDNLQWEVNAGPYLAFGLGGKKKNEVSGKGFSQEDEDDFFGKSDDGKAKRFDMGLQFGTGITFQQHYCIGIAYELGLTELHKDDKDKNNNFMINLGYKF